MKAKHIRERALLGSRWLVNHQNPDGSWRGLHDPKVDAFYKASWALMETGQPASANRSLTYVRNNFFTPEGDFLPREHPWHTTVHYPYANSYFIIGSMLAGRDEIAMPAVNFLLSQQSPEHGGFFSRLTKDGKNNFSDTMSSSAAGLACLAAGKIEAAQRVAEYLSHIVNLQPVPSDYFFTTIKADGRLCTDKADNSEVFYRIIDTKKEDQCWFALGLPFAFLVRLAHATNETPYYDLAQWYFDFQHRCINPWDGSSSGKAGWGCAMLYRITGETGYRDIAFYIAQNIMSRQKDDGRWLSADGQPELTNADLDITAEFTLWLSLISSNILARDPMNEDVRMVNIKRTVPVPKRKMEQTVRKIIRTHYRILRDEGLRKYFLYSYQYRKGQVLSWIKKLF